MNDADSTFEHDENLQAFERDGQILIAIVDETYGRSEDEADWPHEREQFRLELESEFGLRFEDGNIGPGADLPAFLTLLQSDVHVPVWTLIAATFFAGKPLHENMEAWGKMAGAMRRFFKRHVFLNRQGSSIIAVEGVAELLGRQPGQLRLVSYRTENVMDPSDLSTTSGGTEISEAPTTLYLGFVRHIFEIEADGALFRVSVDGTEPTVLRLSD